jgi:hypothetical protein
VLDEIITDCDQRYLPYKVLDDLSYDFGFGLLLMQDVLGVMNELSLLWTEKTGKLKTVWLSCRSPRTNCR